MRVGAVLAAGLVAVAVGLVLVLLDPGPRQAGSNYVPESGPVLTINGNGSHCQGGQVIPGDAARLRLLVGTFDKPMPELRVRVRGPNGGTLASGRLSRGRTEGHVVVPIEPPVNDLRAEAEVCVAVRATSRRSRTVFYGTLEQLRFEWLREAQESWLELLPTVAHRFGLAKPFVSGSWVLALAAALLAMAWAFTLRLAARELSR